MSVKSINLDELRGHYLDARVLKRRQTELNHAIGRSVALSVIASHY